MEYHDDDIFPLLWHLPQTPNTIDDIEQSLAKGGITVQGDFEQLNGDSVRSESPSVSQRTNGVSSCIVGSTPSDMLSSHWPRI